MMKTMSFNWWKLHRPMNSKYFVLSKNKKERDLKIVFNILTRISLITTSRVTKLQKETNSMYSVKIYIYN